MIKIKKHNLTDFLKKAVLIGLGFSFVDTAFALKSPYDAARAGDLDTLRQYRFEGKDLFIPDERGFKPYELAALHADPETKAGLRKQVEVMLWLKEYKPEKHRYGKATIQLIQAGLNAFGYEVGKPDGVLGKRTIDAIKAYQKANKLAETGRPGPQWLGIFYQDILKDTQFKLTHLGYDTKGTDGLMGKNTRAAILAYRDKAALSNPDYIHLDYLLLDSVNSGYQREHQRQKAKIALKARQAQQQKTEYVQAGLRTLGYRIGRVDGVAGSKTTNGIKRFQKKYKLTVTGKANEKTMAKMRTIFLKETQRKLNALGYRVGKPDGKLGKRTQNALNRYKKSVRLETGRGLEASLIAAIDDSYDNRRVVTKKTKKKPKKTLSKKAVTSKKVAAKSTTKKKLTEKSRVKMTYNKGKKQSSRDVVIKPSSASTKKSTRVGARGAKGRMVFRRKGGRVVGCALAGRKIPIEWCEPFYPLPKRNHCEASFKPSTGAVINLWCK